MRYVFILPSLVLFSFAIVYPFFQGIHIAFTNWNGIALTHDFVGLRNFVILFSDTSMIRPIRNTFYFAIVYTVANNIFALLLAVLLSRWVVKRNFIKMLFFIPMALSAVLAAFVWAFIFREVFRELFQIPSLLGNPATVIPGIIIIALWNTLGSNLIIYMAGLDNIPQMYNEASEIDGASPLQQFWHITVPMLIPAFTICITLTLTMSLREFATVMAATGGGPAGYSQTIAINIYRNLFQFQRAGYGQAVSLVFMAILVVIGLTLTRIFRKKEVEY